MRLLICYSDYDIPYVEEIKKNLRNPSTGRASSVLYVRTDKISDLAAVFQKCDLCIVHNSGPRHLAAAVGTKTLGLLQKHDDIKWKIYEDNDVHRITQSGEKCTLCPEDKCLGVYPPGAGYGSCCMHQIKVADVLDYILQILKVRKI
jgi:ADP-heptose:LPS heptosyltransferase